MKNIFYNFPDYDLSKYSYFYLNEIEQGIILVPRFTNDEVDSVDFNLYFGSADIGANFLSTALSIKKRDENDGCTDGCNYIIDDNYDYLIKDYNFSNTIIKTNLKGFYPKITSNNYADYAYHFFSTTYNDDVILYYNSNYFDILVPLSGTASQYRHNDYLYANKEDAVKSWNNVNESVGGILGSFGNISPGYSGSSSNNGGSGNGSSNSGGSGSVSGGDGVNGIFASLNPKDIISNLNGIFSTMVTFINDFLGTFPDGIRLSINFFFIMALAAAIVKLLV